LREVEVVLTLSAAITGREVTVVVPAAEMVHQALQIPAAVVAVEAHPHRLRRLPEDAVAQAL
jgi:hypothetical protein